MDSKRLKNKNTGEDIISRLPDDVLTHILSRLQAKDAFKTCILSSRWKYLWTLIYNIRFQLPFYWEGNHGALFLKFLEHVLCHCRSKNIQEFHIGPIFSSLDCDATRISEWISFAVEHNVRSLSLEFDLPMADVMIRLPQSILTCKSLVRLTLRSWDITLDIPDSVACFPNLKFLSVFVWYPDANLMQKLFRSCPALEELMIESDHAENENVLTFDITVPTLKKLKMNLSSSLVENGVLSHRCVVGAPNLERLVVCNDFLACCVVGETPFLKKVMLGDTHPCFDNHEEANHWANHWATDFFRAISSTRCLWLSSSIMLCLSSSYNNLELPLFPNLIHLDVGIEMFPFQFLNNSPNLEVLVLRNIVNYDDVEGVQLEFEGVPSCMLLHLKKVYVTGVDRRNARLEVVKFLLENSKVLERFAASFWKSKKEGQELRNEILNFPRASPICEIEFVESNYIDKLRQKLYED